MDYEKEVRNKFPDAIQGYEIVAIIGAVYNIKIGYRILGWSSYSEESAWKDAYFNIIQ